MDSLDNIPEVHSLSEKLDYAIPLIMAPSEHLEDPDDLLPPEEGWLILDQTGHWTGLDRTGPDWTGLDRTGPDWTGLDRTGPDRTGLHQTVQTGLDFPDWHGLSRLAWTVQT